MTGCEAAQVGYNKDMKNIQAAIRKLFPRKPASQRVRIVRRPGW